MAGINERRRRIRISFDSKIQVIHDLPWSGLAAARLSLCAARRFGGLQASRERRTLRAGSAVELDYAFKPFSARLEENASPVNTFLVFLIRDAQNDPVRRGKVMRRKRTANGRELTPASHRKQSRPREG
jgi:hypothetical protein